MKRSMSGWVRVMALSGLWLSACGGQTVVDAPDPKACAPGHGCPMVACVCGDDSVVLDTTCELGKCGDAEDLCTARCEDLGGLARVETSEGDVVAVPDCDAFCTRAEINGCEQGCDTFFSECRVPTSCEASASAFWSCVVEKSKMTCGDDALVIEGCALETAGFCE